MITTFRVRNYRCLRDVTLELDPFTVVVGPNASGKTALADALTTERVTNPVDYWRHKAPPAFWVDGTQFSPHHAVGRGVKYVFHPDLLRSEDTAEEVYTLAPNGTNLANLFDTFTRRKQEEFLDAFIKLVPVFADIKARARHGKKRLQFEDRWQSGLWYEPSQVSDGTMLAAAFVGLALQEKAPKLAVIEDPDRGLHPYLQRQVADLLRKLSTGEIGQKPIQVVCTTHSKAFLDYLDPSEVRFISRSRETGETIVQRAPTDNERWQDIYARFDESLGNMWLTGSLGGVPGE